MDHDTIRDTFTEWKRDYVEQAQNSAHVFRNKRGLVTPEVLAEFPESPTAKLILDAYNNFQYGCRIINAYITKCESFDAIILSKKDCKSLLPAFRSYLFGLIKADFMQRQFQILGSSSLFNSYLQHCPGDVIVEYLDFYMHRLYVEGNNGESNYYTNGLKIRWLEQFAQKLIHLQTEQKARTILWSVYYRLGAQYYASRQTKRSIDAFEKCYNLDETSLPAIYACGFTYRNENPRKALDFLHKYLELAPKCDEKYPNALYTVGVIYFNHYHKNKLAKQYYWQGVHAEKLRLPFNPPVHFDPKTVLKVVIDSDESVFEHDRMSVNWTWLSMLVIFVGIGIYAIIKIK